MEPVTTEKELVGGLFGEDGIVLQNQRDRLVTFQEFPQGFDMAEVATHHSPVGRFSREDVEFSFVIFVDGQGQVIAVNGFNPGV